MAPKRLSPLEEPPAASSTEEVEAESEEESEEEQEQENTEQKPKKATSPSIPDKKPSKMAETQSSSSEEGSESESESDSEHPPRGVADPNVKPIASRPMDDAPKVKKPRSKSTAATASVAAAATPTKSTAKRPVENSGGEGKDSKRAKKKGAVADGDAAETEKKSSASGEDSKKPLFQRLWSEDDEIVILKGMIDYSAKKGADPVADVYAFHEFIKKSLHIDVTRTQLMDKMRRLKKKFENNAGKGKMGEDRTFSKPHEQNSYDLSKKVWGRDANNGVGYDQAKSNGKAKKSAKGLTLAEKEQLLSSLRAPKDAPQPKPKKDAEEQNSGPSQVPNESILFNNSIAAGSLDEKFMKEGLGLIDSGKRSELEEKWRKLQVDETEIFLRRIELVREQTKLVLNAYKKH